MSEQFLGVVTHFESEYSQFDINSSSQSRLDTMKNWIDAAGDLGSQIIRIPSSWVLLEETEGVYHQGFVQEQIDVIRYAGESGIQVIYEFGSTPVWARTNPNDTFSLPTDTQVFGDAIAHLYSAFSDANVAQYIAGVEIWNEPNINLYWPEGDFRNDLSDHPQGQGVDGSVNEDAAREYTNLLNTAYDSLKEVDASVTVLGGALAGTDATYLQWMLDNGAQMDGLSVHPYTRQYTGFESTPARPGDNPNDYAVAPGLPDDLNQRYSFEFGLNQLNTVLKDAGLDDVNLWITEMGWRIEDYNDGNTNDDHLVVDSAEIQAAYISEALDIIADLDFVAAATIFQLYDAGDGDFGLLDEAGEWRPSAIALRDFINALEADSDVQIMIGSESGETLNGTAGADYFNGGKGDDFLVGNSGSDVYLFGAGDAADTIQENADATSTDILTISGYAHDGLILSREGDDLIIRQPDQSVSDEIRIINQFSGRAGEGIEEVHFPNGNSATIIWGRAEIEAFTDMVPVAEPVEAVPTNTVYGTIDNDTLSGTTANDLIISDHGNDIMLGSAGDDIFVGVSGNDQINYEGANRGDFVITRNADGSTSVSSDQFGDDLLWDVSGIWFEGNEEWVDLEDFAA